VPHAWREATDAVYRDMLAREGEYPRAASLLRAMTRAQLYAPVLDMLLRTHRRGEVREHVPPWAVAELRNQLVENDLTVAVVEDTDTISNGLGHNSFVTFPLWESDARGAECLAPEYACTVNAMVDVRLRLYVKNTAMRYELATLNRVLSWWRTRLVTEYGVDARRVPELLRSTAC
jgi:hypothetical protein